MNESITKAAFILCILEFEKSGLAGEIHFTCKIVDV